MSAVVGLPGPGVQGVVGVAEVLAAGPALAAGDAQHLGHGGSVTGEPPLPGDNNDCLINRSLILIAFIHK